MGGAIAQETVLRAPERIETLTLVVTWAGGGHWQRRFGELWAKRLPHLSREEHVDELLLSTMSEEFWENQAGVDYLRQMILANPHPQAPEAFERQLDASSRHEVRDRLGAVELPVHIIGAEHDILVPVWKSHELAALIPGARLSIVEGAPHGINVERAEALSGLVLDFLRARMAAR
jgi:pimeloyl-ACP methyl ester carboxylesterase